MRFLRLLSRSAAVIAGYVAACIVAGIAAISPMLPKMDAAAAYAVIAVSIIVTLTFLPALAGILYAEHKRVRSAIFYSAGGVLIAVLSYAAISLGYLRNTNIPSWVLIAMEGQFYPGDIIFFAFCGLIAGFVYWVIAGRRAGQSRGQQ